MKNLIHILICAAGLFLAGGCSDDSDVSGGVSAPELLSIIPKAGYAGNVAIISGSHFSPEADRNMVMIGQARAEVTAATSTRLTVLLPENTLGSYSVRVTVDGLSAEGLSFTYAPAPDPAELALVSVLPTKAYAGDRVLIRGTGFSSDPEQMLVEINGARAEVVEATETTLQVVLPENPAGTYPFTVSLGDKRTEGLLFTYLHKPTLSLASVAPQRGYAGSVLTITGECFSETPSENLVEINGRVAVVTGATTTTLTVEAPENPAGSYPIRVTVDGKTVEGLMFTYLFGKYTLSTWLGTAGRDIDKALVDGAPDEVRFNMPHGLALSPDGTSLWIIDRGNNAIRRTDLQTEMTTTIVRSGQNGVTVNAPWRGSFNSRGDFYCANKAARNILRVTPDYTVSVAISGLSDPLDVRFDAGDNLYVVDRGVKSVLKYAAPDYTQSSTFTTFTGGPLAADFDPAGNLLVALNDCTIVRVAPDGSQQVVAGNGTAGTDDGTPGEPTTARFQAELWGISVDDTGNVYILDSKSHTIRRLAPDAEGDVARGTVETVIGTAGKSGATDGIGNEALLKTPYDVLVAPDGKMLWISDWGNFLVRRATVE